MTSRKLHLFAIICVLLEIYLQPGECQVYSWTNQPGDIYNQPCISDQLNFTWTYTPISPDPAFIEWSKQNAGGTFVAVATFAGTFTPGAAYTGRVLRIGNTAELGLMNPTSADDGTFKVKVTDGGGVQITSDNVLVSTVTPSTLAPSGITATCSVDRKTVTCAGVASLGTPSAVLTLSYGSSSKDNGGTQTTVSEELTSSQTVTCSISGPATECLGAGIAKSASVVCGAEPPPTLPTPPVTTTPPTTNPTTTTPATTTPATIATPSTTTDAPYDKNCICCIWCIIIVVVVVVLLLVCIIVICCVRRNKRRNKQRNKQRNKREDDKQTNQMTDSVGPNDVNTETVKLEIQEDTVKPNQNGKSEEKGFRM